MTQGNFLQHESTELVSDARIYAGPFELTKIDGFNNSGGSLYVQLHDSPVLPSNGATPRYTMRANASGSFSWAVEPNSAGMLFLTGLWVCCSTTPNTLTLGSAVLWVDAEGLQLGPESSTPPPPTSKLYWYFGPGLADPDGPIATWPDVGDLPHYDMTAEVGNVPVTELGIAELNSLRVVEYTAEDPALMSTAGNFPTYSSAFVLSGVMSQTDVAYKRGFGVASLDNTVTLDVQYLDADNAPSDPGWYVVGNDTDFTWLGDGTTIAIALSIDPVAGTFETSYSLDWEAVELLSGAVPVGAYGYLLSFGITTAGDTGTLAVGEFKAWNLLSMDATARAAVIQGFRDVWMPEYPFMRWFGPDLSAGNIASWIDQSVQAVNMENPSVPLQPSASIGLNSLMTAHAPSSHPLYASFDASGSGRSVSTAFVVTASAGAECLYVSLQNDDDSQSMNLQYFSADGPGLFLTLFDIDGNDFSIDLGDAETYAGVAWWDPQTGEYRVTVSRDWDAEVTITGTASLPEGPAPTGFTFGGIVSVSVPYVSAVITQTAEVRVYFPNGPQTLAEQSAIVAELRATWEPPPSAFARFGGMSGNISESGDGVTGWIYTAADGAGGGNGFQGSPSLPASTDGAFTATWSVVGDRYQALRIGETDTDAPDSAFVFTVFSDLNDNLYYVSQYDVGFATTNLINPDDGDLVRITRGGGATTAIAEVSKDGGGSWTELATYPTVVAGELWCNCFVQGGLPGGEMGPITLTM